MVRFVIILLLFPLSLFGQLWEFSDPQHVGSGVNTEYEEILPLISPDGRTMFFSRVLYPENTGGKFAGSDIWVARWDDSGKRWAKAGAVPKLNDKGNNAVVGVSADGNTIYLMKTTSAGKPSGIYFARRIGNTWSRPELIPINNIEPRGFLSFYASPDFEVIFISMRGNDSRGEEDLYVTYRNSSGDWTAPKNLGSSVNTSGAEFSPFLSADKKRLYFSSTGHKGLGDADIFYCDRLYNSWDTWSAPRNLGDKINTKSFEGYFSLYGDTIAYFASNRDGRYADIYKIRVVPGNEILAYGQRYLTTEEMAAILGSPNVSRRVVFQDKSTAVSFADKELLFYIANKVAPEVDVSIQVMVLEDNAPELTNDRLKAVTDELRASGLDNIRLIVAPNERFRKKNPKETVMEILLFK